MGDGISTLLTDARLGVGEGYERMTFQFESSLPSTMSAVYHPPDSEEGPGDAGCSLPELATGWHLETSFYISATREGLDYQGRETYPGPDRLRSKDTTKITEAVLICEFEGQLEWVLVIDQRRPFRVDVLDNPPRFVIDVSTAPG